MSAEPKSNGGHRFAATVLHLNPIALHYLPIFDRHHIWFLMRFFVGRRRHNECARSAQREADNNSREFQYPAHRRITACRLSFSQNAGPDGGGK